MGEVAATRDLKSAGRGALNAVCPYYTMFPLSFPLERMRDLPSTSRVLDPFCGRGTTVFAARQTGLFSTGIDSNPVAVAISKAKLSDATPKSILALARTILLETPSQTPPLGEFWPLAFSSSTLDSLLRLRAGLSKRWSRTADALRGILLGALHGPRSKNKHSYLSNQMPRTFASKPAYSVRYWTERAMTPPDVDVVALIEERAWRYFGQPEAATQGEILLDDARTAALPRKSFSMVITSPPYFGMNTYVPDQWLRYWFLGGSEHPEYAHPDQLAYGKPEHFAAELGKVWANVAPACKRGTKLIVRFGALRSRRSDPMHIIESSLSAADAGWIIEDVKTAGDSNLGKRQAQQMGERGRTSGTVDEYDVTCVLK